MNNVEDLSGSTGKSDQASITAEPGCAPPDHFGAVQKRGPWPDFSRDELAELAERLTNDLKEIDGTLGQIRAEVIAVRNAHDKLRLAVRKAGLDPDALVKP